MSSTRMLRSAGIAAVAVALVVGTAAQAAPPRRKAKPGPNLVVNAGFEQSALEGNPVVPPGGLDQPILPTGWSFEGLTVLFDHTPNTFHSGKRGAAISGSLSGPDRVCPVPPNCVDNPTKGVKTQVAPYYTLAPHWRTAAAIPVTAGVEYTLSTWLQWSIITIGEGSSMKVRWMKADGSPLSESVQVKRATADNSADLPFALQTFKVKAPDGATGAVLLLGQTDDAWTGQVIYDDVYFGTS